MWTCPQLIAPTPLTAKKSVFCGASLFSADNNAISLFQYSVSTNGAAGRIILFRRLINLSLCMVILILVINCQNGFTFITVMSAKGSRKKNTVNCKRFRIHKDIINVFYCKIVLSYNQHRKNWFSCFRLIKMVFVLFLSSSLFTICK